METAKTLRDRAHHWRTLANHHDRGTADALIEAACDLEMRASRLERSLNQAAASLAGEAGGAPVTGMQPAISRR
jgi:hypothetical protein